MKLFAYLAVAVAALVLTASAPARPHHRHPGTASVPRWYRLSLEQKRAVVVEAIRRERAPLRWWLRARSRLPASSSGSLVYCASVGTHLPPTICIHAGRYVRAVHVLHRIDARIAARIAARVAASHPRLPPWLLNAFVCIHRYEGAWNANTGNGYYGGLQMDLSFQGSYGAEYAARWGTADNWPIWAQLDTARRAHDSGRGFGPWPNTARACGLI